MKHVMKTLAAVAILTLVSCGGKEEKKEEKVTLRSTTTETVTEAAPATSDVKPSERVDMSTKGVGPVKSVTIGETIDQAMAAKGEELYKTNCLACHKTDKKFIGPAPKGILDRRTPEWVMNMILDPEGMVKNDPLAKELLVEFNGSPMANQGLTQDEARQIVEYFRTL
ncbi:MAG TPA: cytochrome c [Flavobacteriaceae bacterium]|nr:cytochrome c [Flavobacteriaceae bacterium]